MYLTTLLNINSVIKCKLSDNMALSDYFCSSAYGKVEECPDICFSTVSLFPLIMCSKFV